MTTHTHAEWIETFARQLRKRWTDLDVVMATRIATKLAERPENLEAVAEDAADEYVRWIEEEGRLPEGIPSAFTLKVSNASEGAVSAARRVAMQAFEAAGVSPALAARGYFVRAAFDDGFEEDGPPSRKQLDAALAWDAAQQAVQAVAGEAAFFDLVWRAD